MTKKWKQKENGKTTRLGSTWRDMKQRCFNKNRSNYKYYGGRGITVCDRWLDFQNFCEDMGEHPGEGYSIDRIDVNGNYCPENCKWSTCKEQGRNTRVFNAELEELSKSSGVSKEVLRSRLKSGKTGYNLTKPVNEKFSVNGLQFSVVEFIREFSVDRGLLNRRIKKFNGNIEMAMNDIVNNRPSRTYRYIYYSGEYISVAEFCRTVGVLYPVFYMYHKNHNNMDYQEVAEYYMKKKVNP